MPFGLFCSTLPEITRFDQFRFEENLTKKQQYFILFQFALPYFFLIFLPLSNLRIWPILKLIVVEFNIFYFLESGIPNQKQIVV